MKHEFKFQLGQTVKVLDYDNPRTEHYAAVLRRWLEAYRGNEDPDKLEEQYEVELTFNGYKQRCMFLVDDITEDPDGNYWKLTIGHTKNHWLKKRKDKELAALLEKFPTINLEDMEDIPEPKIELPPLVFSSFGFPQDDEFSLQQGSPCEADLSIFYPYQYVEKEEPVWEQWEHHENYEVSKLRMTNILVGSVTIKYKGEYYRDNSKGYITRRCTPCYGKTLAMINHKSGKMSRRKIDGSAEFAVSYEYDYDKNKRKEEG